MKLKKKTVNMAIAIACLVFIAIYRIFIGVSENAGQDDPPETEIVQATDSVAEEPDPDADPDSEDPDSVPASVAEETEVPSEEPVSDVPDIVPLLKVTFIDIGQGDSELIQLEDHAILIDSGEYEKRNIVIDALKSLGVEKLDYCVATHPHTDHMGSMSAVVDAFDVGKILMPNASATTVAFERLLRAIQNKSLTIDRPVPGTTIQAGGIELQLFAPNNEKYADVNNYSIVARLDYYDTSFLFTGDAEALSEKEIQAKNFDLDVDVLKIGHHGSVSSTSDDFLAQVTPAMAVISCAAGNSYGHPHRETLAKLDKAKVEVFRTDLLGTITITSDGKKLVTSYNTGADQEAAS
ncbi:MAG: MBL fold metallo-hydrolase [Clostridiales bacterium]|jgi:competence protein ComEC|nr:MBL fold metallo-hydrolase [Clostridiales bacterium]